MGQLYSTGPVGVFVGLGSGGAPVYLGHGREAPDIEVDPEWFDVECDLGGKVRIDVGAAGEAGKGSVLLTWYNESVLRLIQDRAALIARGFQDPGEIGTLLLTEGFTYKVWFVFPNAQKAAYQAGRGGPSPLGYRFWNGYVRGPDKIISGSKTARLMQVHWDFLRTFDASVTDGLMLGRWTLYDEDVTGLPPAI